ncbi:MAG: two-component system cell cycle response regulator [Candidatus Midichloriaceae bacterium]|jgi:two-component system cell cycle response regulator
MTAKILIADDIKFNIDILKKKFQEKNYELHFADNGQEALSKAIYLAPDLIIMDIMMPVMDGLSALRAIRITPKIFHTPVIITTSLTATVDKVSAILCGADDYVVKPTDYKLLIARIDSLIKSKFVLDQLLIKLEINNSLSALLNKEILVNDLFLSNKKILFVNCYTEETNNTMNAMILKLIKEGFIIDIVTEINQTLLKALNNDYELIIINAEDNPETMLELAITIKNNKDIKHIPLLGLIDQYNQDSLLRFLEIGINDYLISPFNLDELLARMNRQLIKFRYEKKLRDVYIKTSFIDHLTGLYSKQYLESYFINVLEDIKCNKKNYSFCIIDIDDFKKINDTFGHVTGDIILKEISDIILKTLSDSDFAARFGGEEFVVILKEKTAIQAKETLENISHEIAQSKTLDYTARYIVKYTISAGIKDISEDDTLHSLIHESDIKLYTAKRSGKNMIVS